MVSIGSLLSVQIKAKKMTLKTFEFMFIGPVVVFL